MSKNDARFKLVEAMKKGANAPQIRALLDSMDSQERIVAVAQVRGTHIRALYQLVARDEVVECAPPLCVDDFVPPSIPAGATVTFSGRNSLPLFSRFQKRFTRTADGLVFGYNHQPSRLAGAFTGPGYFLVTNSNDGSAGEVLFDYTKSPPFEPAGWPAYRPNDVLGSRFVFMNMLDRVRPVARGVVVGAAYRGEAMQNAYFTLTSTV